MKIKVAKDIGFCWGVRRALDLALKSATKAHKVYTYGPLIHNENVVEILKAKGVEPFPQRKPKSKDKLLLVIRAHGVAPSVRQKLVSKRLVIVDATCPHVKKSQKLVQTYAKKGYQIIIVGDRRHAEVVSLVGYARDIHPTSPQAVPHLCGKSMVRVISTVPEALAIFKQNHKLLEKRICILAQSTFQPGLYGKIVQVFQRKISDARPTERPFGQESKLVIFNTICHAPARRQDAVRDLAHKVDAIIVVGDHKSANTTNLTLLARSLKIPAFQVASVSELPLKQIGKYSSIGITTGTSTPDSVIQEVIEKLSNL